MGLFDSFKRKNTPPPAPSSPSMTATEVANQLEKLGYFKYANPDDIDHLKSEIGKDLVEEQYFPLVEREKLLPGMHHVWDFIMDPKHFVLDGETLWEEGGVLASLNEMARLFEKMNIRMELTDHMEEYDAANQWVNHSGTINGKKYTLFDKFKGYGWGEAAQRFADMINDQLERQQSDERLFLIYGGNDGRAVFLTEEQYQLINTFTKTHRERPQKVEDWCLAMQVKRVPVY